jgi:hypothetical protein
MTILLIFLLSFLIPVGDIQEAVRLIAKPGDIYKEHSETVQHLNFDLILSNQSEEKLIINRIELSVFDAAGKLVQRTFVDEYSRSSFRTCIMSCATKSAQKKLKVYLHISQIFVAFAVRIR